MFKKLTLISVFGFITAIVFGQTDTTGKLEKYRRSSLMFLTVLHPKDSFYMDIKESVDSLPFPDKYNQIGENSFIKGSDWGDRKANLKDTLSKILHNYKIATWLVGKWYNFNKQTGSFDRKLIEQQGLWNATEADVKKATQTVRGKELLKDEGEELIGKTFLVINDLSYVDFKERAEIAKEAANTTANIGDALSTANTGSGDADKVINLFGKIAKVGGNAAQKATTAGNFSGFLVRVKSYLFQLDWNDDIANIFYANYYTEGGESKKVKDFLKDTANFKMKFLGATEQQSSNLRAHSSKSRSEEIKISCGRTLDKNMISLQQNYPIFKVKVPIRVVTNAKGKVESYAALIGLKESVTPNSIYTVLEQTQDKNGHIKYEKVATLQPIKDKIWDNEYMAGEGNDKDNPAAKLGATFFKKKSGKDLSNGMLIIEGDYIK